MNYTILSIYYWGHDKTMKDSIGYEHNEEHEYSEAKLTEMILHVINKGYQVKTINHKTSDRVILCIDNKNFTTR